MKTQQCLKRPERNRKGKNSGQQGQSAEESGEVETMTEASGPAGEAYTVDTAISDVISDPVFGDYGRLIFPVDSGYYSGNTLGELQLTWYHNIDPDKTVEIANDLRDRAAAGEKRFFMIFTRKRKRKRDPEKEDTGLFFFQRKSRCALCGMQRGRRICLRGRHAGQLSPCAGAVEAGVQRVCPDLSAGGSDSL